MRIQTALLLVFGLLLSASVHSQGLYLRLGGGYALGASGNDVGVETNSTGAVTTYTAVFASMGRGGVFSLDAGYNLDDHIGIQVGVEYLAGANQMVASLRDESFVSDQSMQGQQLRILPAVVIRGGLGNVDPYVRFGLSLPVLTTTRTYFSSETIPPPSQTALVRELEIEETGQMTLGFAGGIGLNYSLGSQLGLFAELSGLSQRVRGKSGAVTFHELNGQDLLESTDVYEKEWNYVSELNGQTNSEGTNEDYDEALPSDRIQFSQNYNAFVFKVGLSYQF